MMLLSETQFPPGGFMFYQPETRWSAPPGSFNATVKAIIEHRKANPRFGLSINPDTVSLELHAYNCVRLHGDPQWCSPSEEDLAASIARQEAEFASRPRKKGGCCGK